MILEHLRARSFLASEESKIRPKSSPLRERTYSFLELTMSRRVIFLIYALPPVDNSLGYQVAKILKYLSRLKSEKLTIEVIAGTGDKRHLREFWKIHLPIKILSSFWENNRWIARFKRFVLNLQPDIRIFWVKSVIRLLLKKLTGEEILVTFSHPVSLNLAGIELKRRGVVKRWVAYLSDPWCDNPYWTIPKRYMDLHRSLELDLFSYADILLVPSEKMRDFYREKYPQFADKIFVFLHSADPELFEMVSTTSSSEKVLLRHVGAIYGKRDPMPIYEAISLLAPVERDRLRFEQVGPVSHSLFRKLRGAIRRLGVSEVVSFYPEVPYLESLRYMKEADVLVVIDAPTDFKYFFPAKLSDYLFSGRYIIAVTPRESTTWRILSQFSLPSFAHDEIDKLSSFLRKIISSREILNVHLPSEELKTFLASENAAKLLSLLTDL